MSGTIFVLFLVVAPTSGLQTPLMPATAEFSSKAACEAAADAMRDRIKERWPNSQILTFCAAR